MKTNKKQGISLIVLVITIIIMIILAAAIILSLNSSGIIGKASDAKSDSNTATINEALNVIEADAILNKNAGDNDKLLKSADEVIAKLVEDGVVKEGELVKLSTYAIGYADFSEIFYVDAILEQYNLSLAEETDTPANTIPSKSDIASSLEESYASANGSSSKKALSGKDIFYKLGSEYDEKDGEGKTLAAYNTKSITLVGDSSKTLTQNVLTENGSQVIDSVVLDGINTTGQIMVYGKVNKIVIRNCTAKNIRIENQKTHGAYSYNLDVTIDNCTITGTGATYNGEERYGMYIVLNANYNLKITNCTLQNTASHAICVNVGSGATANSIEVAKNKFISWGLDDVTTKEKQYRAAFKIYGDAVLAPSSIQGTAASDLPDASKKLAVSVINNNTFTLTGANVYCDFFGVKVSSLSQVQ